MNKKNSFAKEIFDSGLFDAAWYKKHYPDVDKSGLDSLDHFLRFGVLMRRSPGPNFNTRFYLSAYPDVAASDFIPIVHYIRYGKKEKRSPFPGANAKHLEHESSGGRTVTMLADESIPVRIATMPFMWNELTPCAPIAVLVNLESLRAWPQTLNALNELKLDHDLFIFGDETTDFFRCLAHTKSITLLGSADEPGRMEGFVRFASSGALDEYNSLLWLTLESAESDMQPIRSMLELAPVFRDDPDWGCAAERFEKLDNENDGEVLKSLRIALPRLGLSLPDKEVHVPIGDAIWLRPILLRSLRVAIRTSEIIQKNPSSIFIARKTVLAILSVIAQVGRLEVRSAPLLNTLSSTSRRELKAVAFYLPQFHPIAENNRWWGKGFTEWSNVVRGKPLFRHHYQPRVPADLGYYDLRLEATQVAQAELARKFGIHGFCYYYYWFDGKKLLNQPIEQLARSKEVDVNFCVCWANENWSRNWDGQNRHVLIKQDYSLESNRALILELIPMMKDPRWIRYQGKPLMLVYRISIIPNWAETAQIWREECRKAGLGEIHLCAVRFGLETLQGQPQEFGLDSYVQFPPHESSRKDLRKSVHDLHKDFNGEIFEYNAVADGDIEKYANGYEWPIHRGAMLGWDNTARRLTDARVFHGATPFGFRRWVKSILEQEERFNPGPESLLFINAWNEWAEGTYLEPDQRWGTSNLEAFSSAVHSTPTFSAVTAFKGVAAASKLEERIQVIGSSLVGEGFLREPVEWYSGVSEHNPKLPSILLCAHISGHHLFGGERSLIDVLNAFSKMPVNVIVTLPSGGNKTYVQELCNRCNGVYVFKYPQWMQNRNAFAWLTTTFADIIAQHAIDVVHVNTIVLLEPLLAARRMGVTAVTHVRELIALDDPLREQMGLQASDIISQVLRRSDWIIGNSLATVRLFAKGDKTAYVPNAVDPSALDMNNKFGKTIKFGIVSSNIPKKGVEDFVEVARRASDVVPNARFVIVGPYNDQIGNWISEIERGERPANLNFAGYRENPRSAMSELNVVLNLSSFAESFGRTVAEALAARRPVIAYNWGAISELVQHGETGYLVPYRDIDAVVNAIVSFIRDPSLVLKMGEKGRSFISEHFSQERLYAALASAYEKVLERPMFSSSLKSNVLAAPNVLIANHSDIAPRTTIVVPVYNAATETKNCIDSIVKHTNLERNRVILIDDGSPDKRVGEILELFSTQANLDIYRNKQNIGYTRTINLGLQKAEADDVVLLNSDTIVTPRWLEGLRATAYCREKVGTVTAMSDNAGAFSFPKFNEFCRKPEYFTHEEYALLLTQATHDCIPPEVPTGSGFCMYIRRALVNACGMFDEAAFPRGYGEENDFCMRAFKAGWINLISPWSFVYHVRTASFKGEKAELVKSGVNTVTARYPDYAPLVRNAFESPVMQALRSASSKVETSNYR